MRSLALLVSCALLLGTGCTRPAPTPTTPLRVGVAAFGDVDPIANVELLAGLGFDYIEPALSKLAARTDSELAAARARVHASGIAVEAMNWFLPGDDIKVTGPDVDEARVLAYVERALGIAQSFGAKVIVFGSPAARSFPDGFPRERANEQLVSFLRLCDSVIERNGHDLVIALEALRRPETNLVNSLAEALSVARAVNRKHVRLVCDFYHLAFENEDPEVLVAARDWIVHLQIADPRERGFPRTFDGEPRYQRFFAMLRHIDYRGRISIEANSADLATDARRALALLRQQTGPERPAAAGAATPHVAARIDGDVVHVTVGGEPFASVHTAALPRPFVFPLLGPGGVHMTRGYPIAARDGEERDHPHHTSLWFAHGDVNGFDFWHGTDRRERIALDGAPVVTTTAQGVRVACRYRLLVDDDTAIGTEERELVFAADPALGTRAVDAIITLRPATAPLVLGDTKEGAFALRVHSALRAEGKGATGRLGNSEGHSGAAVWGKRARWIDDSGTIDGQEVGVAMFDHPANHGHPTWWHARTYGLLAANPFGVHDFERKPKGTGNVEVPVGSELRLRYRVLLHGAGWNAQRIEAAFLHWVATTLSLR